MRRTRILIAGWVLVHVCGIAGCASGTGHVESLMRSINTVDAVVVGAAGLLLYELGPGWSASVVQSAERRYRIAVVRSPWPGGGDGEFVARFSLEAKRIATEKACNGFRVLAYSERYEVTYVFFTNRVGEGEIECL